MTTSAQAWERFATKAIPRREVNAAGARTWLNWTQYADHGPDESVLGQLHGKRIVELGSGTGANLAHLATLGARCVGIDVAPTRTAAATRSWVHLPNIEFITDDAADHLMASRLTYDIVYSIFGAIWFTDPDTLLPLIRAALVRGGILAFSHLPASATPPPADRLITQYHLPVAQWEKVLRTNGFAQITAEIIPAPVEGKLGTLFVRAVRV